jgi:hypothetical protein
MMSLKQTQSLLYVLRNQPVKRLWDSKKEPTHSMWTRLEAHHLIERIPGTMHDPQFRITARALEILRENGWI